MDNKIASLIHQIEQADAAFAEFSRRTATEELIALGERLNGVASKCRSTAVLMILERGPLAHQVILHGVTRSIAQEVLNRLQAEEAGDDDL